MVLKILIADPSRFSDGRRYVTETMPIVRPKVILANRSGQFLVIGRGEPDDFRVLFSEDRRPLGSRDQKIRSCYYIDLKKTDEGVVGGVRFEDRHWVNGFQKSRHIRLMTEGRRQAHGSELDAFIAERELEEDGIELRFRAGHEYPEPDRSAEMIFELLSTKTLTCQISGREITPDSAILLNPWDFERYAPLREALAQYNKLGICPTHGSFEDDRIGNWTWWLVHSDYLRLLERRVVV